MRLRLSLAVVAALLLGAVLPAWAWENYEQGANVPVITVPAAPPSPERLPIFGVMADVGVPDGLIGSLAIRPWKWVRLCGGGGTNSISSGWRAGITLLPFAAGPSASFEYGGYQDGNANPLAKKITMDSASLAKDTSKAAAKGDAQTVKTKLGEIMAKCGECHVKIRDKNKK